MSIPPPPPSGRESLPSLSGLYDVLFELGRGGMGTVSLARMAGVSGFERLVVVKRMHRDLSSRVHLQRFVNEAKIASHVHHANVVGVQVIGEDMDGYFLVLDYVEGDSLASLVETASNLGEQVPIPVVLRVVLDALAGLHAIHEACDKEDRPLGILHRDISTCNLLVGADGVTRITDFGVAKSTGGAALTGDLLVGKVLYMAPEYLLQSPVDRRMDIYAMGVLLWLALVGEDPWGSDISVPQLMSKAVSEGVPRLPANRAPAALADVIAQACARKPENRFETARAMANALAAAANGTVGVADPYDVAALVAHLAGPRLKDRRRLAGRSASRASIPDGVSSVRSSRGNMVLSPRPGAVVAETQAELPPPSLPAASTPIPSTERVPSAGRVPTKTVLLPTPTPRISHATSASIPPPPLQRVASRGLLVGIGAGIVLAVAAAWALRSPSAPPPSTSASLLPSSSAPPSAAAPVSAAPEAPPPDPPPTKTKRGTKVSGAPPPSGGARTIDTGNPYR